MTVPYCDEHERAFDARFRRLEIAQYVMIASAFSLFIVGTMIQDLQEIPGRDGPWSILASTGMLLFFIGLPATLIVRRYLYDVFFRWKLDGLQISSKQSRFLENLRALSWDYPDSK